MNPSRLKLVEYGEWFVCVFASLAAVWLHLVFLTHAGGFWRDEACGVATALMPTLRELWRFLTLDSAGLVSPLLLRGWATLGLGQSDFGWRLYGMLIGVALLGGLWFNARMLGGKWPVISLGLLAASPVLVRWGDSVRAYGLACLLMLLTLGLVWLLAQRQSPRRFVLAAIASVLSVHTLYGNAFLLLAVGLSASVVCLRHRQWRAIALVLGVGFIAAVSMLPYVPGVRASSHNWWLIQKSGFLPDYVWFNFTHAAGSPYDWQAIVWEVLTPLAAVAGLVNGWRGKGPDADLHLFAALTIVLAAGLFMLFISLSGLQTQLWYFLPLLVLVAACANAVLPEALAGWFPAPVTALPWLRVAGLAFVGGMVLISWPRADDLARARQTNVDQLAAYLTAKAEPGDVIVVHPWYCGVSFQRYYRGRAAWLTAPPMEDHRIQRFDVLMEQMRQGDPMPPVVRNCTEALRSGHRVWLLGSFEFNGRKPPVLPKAPHGPQGWNEGSYEEAWAAQIPYLITNHASELAAVPEDPHQAINIFEHLPLYYATGWRADSAPLAGRDAQAASSAGTPSKR